MNNSEQVLISRILKDAQDKAEGGEVDDARALLVLALDISGGSDDVLVRVQEVRESIRDTDVPRGSNIPAPTLVSQEIIIAPPPPFKEEEEDEDVILPTRPPLIYKDQGRRLEGVVELEEISTDKGTFRKALDILFLLCLIAGSAWWWYNQEPGKTERQVRHQTSAASAELSAGRAQEALDLASSALSTTPSDVEANIIAAEAIAQLSKGAGAKVTMTRADGISETWQQDIRLGRAWKHIGEPLRAADAYYRAFTRGGSETKNMLKEILDAQLAAGRTERAERIRALLGG